MTLNLGLNISDIPYRLFFHQQKDASVNIVINKRLLTRIAQTLEKLFSVKPTLKVLKCGHVEDIQNVYKLCKNH